MFQSLQQLCGIELFGVVGSLQRELRGNITEQYQAVSSWHRWSRRRVLLRLTDASALRRYSGKESSDSQPAPKEMPN